jgi:hypothetical protein
MARSIRGFANGGSHALSDVADDGPGLNGVAVDAGTDASSVNGFTQRFEVSLCGARACSPDTPDRFDVRKGGLASISRPRGRRYCNGA